LDEPTDASLFSPAPCSFEPVGPPPHQLGLSLSASAPKSSGLSDPRPDSHRTDWPPFMVHRPIRRGARMAAALLFRMAREASRPREKSARARDPNVLSDLPLSNRLPSHVRDAHRKKRRRRGPEYRPLWNVGIVGLAPSRRAAGLPCLTGRDASRKLCKRLLRTSFLAGP
jgi:hypothetical protein